MNRHIGNVFWYEFTRNIKRKSFLFATFGIPILGFIVMFGFQAISQTSIQDVSQTTQGSLLDGLRRIGYVDETGILNQPEGALGQSMTEYEDVESVQQALDEGEIDTYYIIPADFFETGNARQVIDEMSLTSIDTNPIRRLMRVNMGDDIDPQLLRRLQNPSDLKVIDLSRSAEEDAESVLEADMFMIYVFSMVFMLAIFMTNGYLMQSIIEEKETRLIEILISSLSPLELLTGKIMAMGALGLFQVAVWVTWMFASLQLAGNLSAFTTTVLAQIEFPVEQLPIMLAYLVLGYLFFAAGYSMIGALMGAMRDAQQMIAVLVVPAIIPFYFFSIIASEPNSTLSIVLSMIPFTSPLAMIMRLSVGTVPIEQVLLSLMILAAGVAGMIGLTARLFRFQILLAGQAPRLRDLPRLIVE